MGKLIKNDGINKIKIVLDFHSSENNQKDSFFSDKEGNPISDKIVTSIFQIIAKFKKPVYIKNISCHKVEYFGNKTKLKEIIINHFNNDDINYFYAENADINSEHGLSLYNGNRIINYLSDGSKNKNIINRIPFKYYMIKKGKFNIVNKEYKNTQLGYKRY